MKGAKSDMAKNNYCIYAIILPSYEKVKFIDNISYKKAKEIGEELDKIKGKHYVIDRMDYIEERSIELLKQFISYDETEMCERQIEWQKSFVIGWNPCGTCLSWNVCNAKNKAASRAM